MNDNGKLERSVRGNGKIRPGAPTQQLKLVAAPPGDVMRYFHVPNTTGLTCNCGAWIDHFRNYGKGSSAKCAVYGCGNAATLGGHVKKQSYTDGSWYIVPMCDSCNQTYDLIFDLKAGIEPAWANVQYTCG